MAAAIITREQYNENVNKLTKEYEDKKAAICKKYGIKTPHYEMLGAIVENETFKKNIPELARHGAAIQGEGPMVVKC